MKSVSGKTAFITGGASGLGLAMARSFAAAGMKVAIADVEKGALSTVQKEFDATNASVITIQTDVSQHTSVRSAVEETIKEFNKVHVLVNNAGIATGGGFANSEPNDWRWTMNVNLDGVYNGIHALLPHMLEHGEEGHVVNTASLAGHFTVPNLGIYSASKFAVVAISEALVAELAESNLGVSVLCPGVVNTNIFTSNRNRPDQLRTNKEADFTEIDNLREEQPEDPVMRTILEPSVVGEMVLHAILEDQFYIFTHPNLAPMVQARMAGISQAFDYWERYVQSQS